MTNRIITPSNVIANLDTADSITNDGSGNIVLKYGANTVTLAYGTARLADMVFFQVIERLRSETFTPDTSLSVVSSSVSAGSNTGGFDMVITGTGFDTNTRLSLVKDSDGSEVPVIIYTSFASDTSISIKCPAAPSGVYGIKATKSLTPAIRYTLKTQLTLS